MFSGFTLFDVSVEAISDLTPSMRRVTFVGADLAGWADTGWDQRIKLILPAPECGYDSLPDFGEGWHEYMARPLAQRCVVRTYTTRAVRRLPDGVRVDVDAVRHSDPGPATSWVFSDPVGESVKLLGPVLDFDGPRPGIDFVPPEHTGAFLLGGDATAAPALARILEQADPQARGIAVIEMPEAADAAYMPSHPGIEVRVVARGERAPGEALVEGIKAAAEQMCPAGSAQRVEEIDVDSQILWEVPRSAKGGAALKSADVYAWLAGEAGAVKAMRRHLVGERGLDRRTVAFMGYWRIGRAEG